MPEYRRAFAPGGTFFFTLVTYQRKPLFNIPANVEDLRCAMRQVRAERPFDLVAAVILPDHLHLILTLPRGDADYSIRLGRIKAGFTRLLRQCAEPNVSARNLSRLRHREAEVWQRRFWEHVIRDDADLQRHLDYIHYNPVRHQLVPCPHAWPYSSFGQWVERKAYEANWCCACGGGTAKLPYPQEMDKAAGE